MPTADDERAYEQALHAELVRRVETISSYPDDAFGHLGRADVLALALACVLLPALLLWWAR